MELRKSPVSTKIRLDQQLRIQLSESIKVDQQKRQLKDRGVLRERRGPALRWLGAKAGPQACMA